MKKFGIQIQFRNLLKEYRAIPQNINNIAGYESYYMAYINFIKNNRILFQDEILERWGLDTLISIKPKEYIVENPEIDLSLEIRRLEGVYENIDDLAMSIRDTLWSMITIYSNKSCPITPNDELRYVKIKCNNLEEILLECPNCIWTEDIYGNEYNGPEGKIFPIRKNEIDKVIKQ